MHKEFDKALKRIARPPLERAGYLFDGRRRFVKQPVDGKTLVIEYQLGIRGAQGTFTINLIKDDNSVRLNTVNPALFARIVHSLFGSYDPWWKDIFLPRERWCKISPFQKEMDTIIGETVEALMAYGIAWLESNSMMQ